VPRRKGGGALALVKNYDSVRDILIPYRRVSTREQADSGAGLAAQFTTLTAGLTMRGQTALHWDAVDKGKSGKDLHRKGLNEALALVRAGEAGGIIVSKLDRLSRSLLDFATLAAQAEKEGWNIVALDLGVDFSTPAGKLMAGVLALFAEFERNVIRQRTKDGLAEKRAEGVILGRRRAISDDLLAAILGMYHADPNYSAVARLLNEAQTATPHGGKKWYPSTIQKIVQAPYSRELMEQIEDVA
jgi:DNA invertase Pin-like site-specific DNA recombinase